MHKLCYLIVLQFVIKIALGSTFVHDLTHNDLVSNGKFFKPVTDKNVQFEESVSTPILQRLDLLEDSVEALVTEIAKTDSLSAVLNDTKTLKKYAVNKIKGYPRNCREATNLTRPSGVYRILLEEYRPEPVKVYCEEDLFDGGWTVVARRMDGSVNFDRNWTDYKQGFGNLNGEFFIGLDKLYVLTNKQSTQELLFVMEDFENNQRFEKYTAFAIGDESQEYFLKTLGNYSGNAGNSFSMLRNQTFQTNDRRTSEIRFGLFGPSWHIDTICCISTLFGWYVVRDYPSLREFEGIIWYHPNGTQYLNKYVQMMIRPSIT